MTRSTQLSRRSLLAGVAALPLASAATRYAAAAAPMLGPSSPDFMRVKLGDFEVTNMLVGSRTVPGPQNIFGMNISADVFNMVCDEAGLSKDAAQFFFHPPVVNTGKELILFDTGLQGPGTSAALQKAGYSADQIDVVVLTHMHGDHIGGLWSEGTETFPNARYVTGRVEFDAWASQGNERFDKVVKPLADKMSFLEGGQSVASGVTAVEAFGHTPGHMVYMLESNGKQMLLAADFANHYVWSLARPHWEVKFDMDKAGAAATRVRLLDMLYTDKIPFSGYHMPFPAIGYVDMNMDGYSYVPHSYQLSMGTPS